MSDNRFGYRIIHTIAGITVFFLTFISLGNIGMAVENTGSICIRYSGQNQENEKIMLSGAEFALYKVGTIQGDEWILTEEFKDSGVSLTDHTASGRREQAEKLWKYALEHNIHGTIKKTDSSGIAQFDNLSEGFYLSAQTKEHAYGEREIFTSTPSLVSIPAEINGEVLYQVTIEPKSERKIPDSPKEPSQPEKKVKTGDSVSVSNCVILIIFMLVSAGICLRRWIGDGSLSNRNK